MLLVLRRTNALKQGSFLLPASTSLLDRIRYDTSQLLYHLLASASGALRRLAFHHSLGSFAHSCNIFTKLGCGRGRFLIGNDSTAIQIDSARLLRLIH